MIYRMELRGKKPNDLLWIDFSYAVAALSIDIVENIIALRPHVVTQPGKKLCSLTVSQSSTKVYTYAAMYSPSRSSF